MGIGSSGVRPSARNSYSGAPASAAAAWTLARETARAALAPSRSRRPPPAASASASSTARQSRASMPRTARASGPSALRTAASTPAPAYRPGSPSRSSRASWDPVDAPLGTVAAPLAPLRSVTAQPTVGRPRESSASQATTSAIRASGIQSAPRPRRRWRPDPGAGRRTAPWCAAVRAPSGSPRGSCRGHVTGRGRRRERPDTSRRPAPCAARHGSRPGSATSTRAAAPAGSVACTPLSSRWWSMNARSKTGSPKCATS